MVLPKNGTKKIPLEMNASDNVGELRKELQKLNQRIPLEMNASDNVGELRKELQKLNQRLQSNQSTKSSVNHH
jgi:hypothetical protein